ncbi:MAG: sigma-54 dependent transcriptional regulator [Deltaproteobacteria bacterium]|jgi:two-component system response regulator HydG|nr:sigma-54 dependent transcriptional regulator [Deltaproteobacteria bacterium]
MADEPILIVDDDPEHLFMLKTVVSDWGYATETTKDGGEAVRMADAKKYSLILMDVRMGVMDGLTALSKIKEKGPNTKTPVIIMTAYSSVEDAVWTIKSGGAYDYITKPLDLDKLRNTMSKALEHQQLKTEKEEALWGQGGSIMVGQSQAFKNIMDTVALVAPYETTVLITGESGVGKEVVARLVQSRSSRANAHFITINCAAIPETLIESELFGHVKGAFTGAQELRQGRLRSASGGTVFLDEIAEVSQAIQVKFLRAIQEGEIQPVGSDKTEKVDVRFIAATNKDLEKEVEAGRFRQDLFYRLNVMTIHVPPLRERKEDLIPLANYFIQRFSQKNRKEVKGITSGALDAILKYNWPGNIRELQNVMERAVILSRGEYVSEKDLPSGIKEVQNVLKPVKIIKESEDAGDLKSSDDPPPLEEIEKQHIQSVLIDTGGNLTKASGILKITRKTLSSKIKKYNIDINSLRQG